ncbi:hypothetical protein CHARACLAT_014057 [Characodon lateralis]|uniref:Uncharacterized protein n=1 Tax=Characodon lateralis TaxID=208331 RepID=A0ABU7DSV9_9TELE|nr:hypothetical protein [Characodon lateralis]
MQKAQESSSAVSAPSFSICRWTNWTPAALKILQELPGTLCLHRLCESTPSGNNFNLREQDNRFFEIGSEEAFQSAESVTTVVGWKLPE